MKLRPYLPYIIFSVLALGVLLPLVPRGYILTLDMVFTPAIRVPDANTSSFVFYAILHLLNAVIPSDILEKIVLFSILFLSGYGMYRLVRYAQHTAAPPAFSETGAYIAGALYMINPYTYDRFMAGQFAVLSGYVLLPFFLVSLLKLFERPGTRASVSAGVWLTCIGILSIHTLGLAAILIAVGFLLSCWRDRQSTKRIAEVMRSAFLSIGIFLAVSCYWLIPLLLGRSTAGRAIAGFSASDSLAFATIGNGLVGKLFHVLRLQGFWAESVGEFTLPQTHLPGWGIVVCILWVTAAIGVVALERRDEHFIVRHILISAGAGALLAAGLLSGAFNVAPVLRGFREPDKFAGLLAIAYAFFAGNGVAAAGNFLVRRNQYVALNFSLAAALLLPVVLTPPMYWGFGGQLHPVQYPAAWAAMNTTLNQDRTSFRVLFLPWHLYMYFSFADRIIMNPAPNYFDKPVLSSNDPEYGGASPDKPDTDKTLLSSYVIPSEKQGTMLGKQLAAFQVKYILLDKDNDYTSYSYLDRQQDLRFVQDNSNFRLYRNTAFRE